MKKLVIVLGICGVVIIIAYSYLTGVYNEMVTGEEQTKQSWAQVENVYQRRLDLIPNLVETVKGAANFERETLEAVINARSKATSIQVDPANLSPAMLQQFQSSQGELSNALSRLMVSVERYPELKATQNFADLQAQLEGTENRITVERRRFNEVVQGFNTLIRLFPNSLFASMFGFSQKGYFEADQGAENAPKVSF